MQAVSQKPRWKCSECNSTSFVDREGWRWCTECGVGERILEPLHNIPGVGDDTCYSPENLLAFGRNLGTPALNSRRDSKALYKVLGRHNRKNLGIRAIQVRNECMASQENTITQRMKNYLSHWCKQFGWQDHVLLSNSLGAHAKWIGSLLTLMNDGKNSKELARGIMVLDVKKFFGTEKASMVAKQIGAKNLFIGKAREIIHLDRLLA